MKLYLPSKKEGVAVGVGLMILAAIFIIGMCIRVNDACHGKLGEWLDALMEWIIGLSTRRRSR